MPKSFEQIAYDAQRTIAYYVASARIERRKAIEALDSNRRDRLSLARSHWRLALEELARAKFERDWSRRVAA